MDLQWRLVSLAGIFRLEHPVAHDHLMKAAASVNRAITYLENCEMADHAANENGSAATHPPP